MRNRQIRIAITCAQFREVAKITDPDQRRALREVIEEFTELSYLVNLTYVHKLELQTALDRVTSTRGAAGASSSWSAIPLFTRSAELGVSRSWSAGGTSRRSWLMRIPHGRSVSHP